MLVNVLRLTMNVTLFASLGFLGAVLALRSNRDDFAFIIPYVRFRQDSSSGQPVVLDRGRGDGRAGAADLPLRLSSRPPDRPALRAR